MSGIELLVCQLFCLTKECSDYITQEPYILLLCCLRLDVSVFGYLSKWLCLWVSEMSPPLSLEEFEEKEFSFIQGRETTVWRRGSLGNTSLHRDQMTPPLKEYSTSVLYYTILYYTKRIARSQQNKERYNYLVYYILEIYVCQFHFGK